MDIGTDIAIVGIWLFPTACALSRTITTQRVSASLIIAFIFTLIILYH